ncbi:hypothetical protein B0T16DRAFT_61644 [Cercophora newfieldiana]|uniref:Uncharacterized protein n=1 Tax=Cercophora newfieldiana TaxID=92897 RepID=A0AA40CZM2_9PEZI|nr:hypothetical protein B0T16DRAFT_61644 [Cercophora newfieldiana]
MTHRVSHVTSALPGPLPPRRSLPMFLPLSEPSRPSRSRSWSTRRGVLGWCSSLLCCLSPPSTLERFARIDSPIPTYVPETLFVYALSVPYSPALVRLPSYNFEFFEYTLTHDVVFVPLVSYSSKPTRLPTRLPTRHFPVLPYGF